ncbi:MAG: B12-binding domain-containing radical SAM protein [Betaproteobacteria bacterium]|nr:B12-binding domain-containing radical SAM protein [Betaproteobacteria bacterium]
MSSKAINLTEEPLLGDKSKLDLPKVALINVIVDGDYQFQGELPIGLASVGAFLRQQGYSVGYQQCIPGHAENEIFKAADIKADVYGFSLNMNNLALTVQLIKEIKNRGRKAYFICGGPFLASSSALVMSNETSIDFMAMGEGEYTMLELLQSLALGHESFGHIAGLVWRDNTGKVIENGPRKVIKDLDELPFPDRDFLESGGRDSYGDSLETARISTSRGCVAHCTFCNVNFFSEISKGKLWRGRSAKKVVDEIELLVNKYRIKKINFSDSSFDDPGRIGKERSAEICNELLRREINVSAKIYLRCDTMKTEEDMDLLRLYKKAGIDVIIVGVEAGSDDELKFYEKNATMADNYRMVNLLRDMDIFYYLTGFIMFGPNSTMSTLRANINFLHEVGTTDNLNHISNGMMLIRGSKLYRMLKAENRVIESNNVCELPLYLMLDKQAEKMARLFQNIFARFPLTLKVNDLQVKSGNLISRMLNPMNKKAHDELYDEYVFFKENTKKLNQDMANAHYDFFSYLLDSIESNQSEEKLEGEIEGFFTNQYKPFLPKWDAHYNEFVERLTNQGFGAAGLIFAPFYSAAVNKGVKRL